MKELQSETEILTFSHEIDPHHKIHSHESEMKELSLQISTTECMWFSTHTTPIPVCSINSKGVQINIFLNI